MRRYLWKALCPSAATAYASAKQAHMPPPHTRYCREWEFVAGFYDSQHFIMRELCGYLFCKFFTPNRERTLGIRFVQQYRTFENYYAGCR